MGEEAQEFFSLVPNEIKGNLFDNGLIEDFAER